MPAAGDSPHATADPAAEVSARLERRLRNVACVLAGYALLGGLTSFAGWVFDLRRLTDWIDSGVSIQPNTALAVACAGAGLLLLARQRPRGARIFGAVVAFIGVATLLEWITHLDFGIDSLFLFGRTWGRLGVIVPGRMGPPGALSSTLIGTGLLLAARGGRARAAVPSLAGLTMGISLLSLIGYAFDSDILYMLPRLTVIAFQTSTFVMASSLALVFNLRAQTPVKWLADAGPAGTLVRRAAPLLVFLPIALGSLGLLGNRLGMYDVPFGIALRTVVEIALLLGLLWWSAGAVARQVARASDQERAAEAQRVRLLQSERQAREEAERASQVKDEFLATLSHELRTPLNAILGWVRILEKRPDDPATAAEAIGVISRNARAQAALISDLLDMNRIMSGKIRLDLHDVPLDDAVAQAIEAIRPAADAKQVSLQAEIDHATGTVRADASRLQQVLWNLLSNAVKFTPKGGRVQVRLAPIDGQAEIAVADTGAGISSKFLPYVFERFRQADSSTTREHGGLGLGLAIVKNLVDLHGGTVRAASTGEGQGATFTIRLPLEETTLPAVHRPPGALDEEETAATAPMPEEVDLEGVTVLAVDDQEDARDLLKVVLERCHARVLTAGSADEALRVLERARPDIVLCDIGMPGKDGYGFIRDARLRGDAIPALAVTAFAHKEDRIRALRAGYQGQIAKPVEPAELVSAVAAFVRMARDGAAGPARKRNA